MDGNVNLSDRPISKSCKQFWKAGDYEGAPCGNWDSSTVGMDHLRVHPKFLHSNATSHKWALGAFAELLDNALDEVGSGAKYVSIDMLVNKKDGSKMLLIEDNGGGMDPDKIRQCMSLGYSVKSKLANTIGQYGNGFKTSTMRLGADVIVFSRCSKSKKSGTQSIGLLSYTFLRSTRKEDIVVPMLDYERNGREWNKMIRSSAGDWDKNVETIVQWSPFSSEGHLLSQFNMIKNRGTRIIIYNLWEDDEGQLELDFDADPHDIQIRGVNREERNIRMAEEFPNSKHYLMYRHSLRSYASILYLRLPPGFRIILRGKDVEHHNIIEDMMMSQELVYRPQMVADGTSKGLNMAAVVTIGFVKDAVHHIDVSGFNVYHKNRLIKPFWRVWNPAGSGGRGVIGVLEANFIEPAHDKQGFERTTVLSRLESRLVVMQKNYWSTNCHKIGYVSVRNKIEASGPEDRETSSDYTPNSDRLRKHHTSSSKGTPSASDKLDLLSNKKCIGKRSEREQINGHMSTSPKRSRNIQILSESSSSDEEDVGDDIYIVSPEGQTTISRQKRNRANKPIMNGIGSVQNTSSSGQSFQSTQGSQLKEIINDNENHHSGSDSHTLERLKEENCVLKERLEKREEVFGELRQELQLERDKSKSFETKLQAAQERINELNKEQEILFEVFSEERNRADATQKILKKKLQDAYETIQELQNKVRVLEKTKSSKS